MVDQLLQQLSIDTVPTEKPKDVAEQILDSGVIAIDGKRRIQRQRISSPKYAHNRENGGDFDAHAIDCVDGGGSFCQGCDAIMRDIIVIRKRIES